MSENKGSMKVSTKHKPLSDFVMRNTSCPCCGKRIDLALIQENICPVCGSSLAISQSMIISAHEAAIRYTEEKKTKKKEKLQKKKDEQKPDEKKTEKPAEVKNKQVFDDRIEIGSFVFVGKKNKEYMVIERKKKSYLCLPVIPDVYHEDGQYVQRVYKDRLVVISEPVGIAPNQIVGIKARLAIQDLNNILEKYRNYTPKVKPKIKGMKSGAGRSNQNTNNNYRRSGDGLYDGNAWAGLAMTTTHVKIFRG